MSEAQVQDQEVELTPEQIVAQQLEGFQEAETSTTKESDVTQTAASPQKAEEAAAEKAEAERVAAEAAEKEVVPGYTQAALRSALEKASQFDSLKSSLDRVNGKFGSMEQLIKQLQESKTAGSQIVITEEDVADLKQEYGPELAGALMKTLNKFGAKLGGAKAAEPAKAPDGETRSIEDFDKKVDEKVTEATNTFERKLLNVAHPDWRKYVRAFDAAGNETGFNPEFVKWASSLSAEDQDMLYNGWDAGFLSGKVGEFKQHLKAQSEAASAAATKGKPKSVPKRIESNVVVDGVPGTFQSKTALQEQMEGYNEAR